MRTRLLVILGLSLGVRTAAAEEAPILDRALARVHAGLRDPDRGVRYAAVEALGKAREASLDSLVEALSDPEWCVRQEAAWWLRRRGEPALARLAAVVKGGDSPARASAVWALSSFGTAAVPLLRDVLANANEADAEVHLEAIAAAGRLGTEVGAPLVPLLRTFLDASSSNEKKTEAENSLEVLDPKPAEPPEPPPTPREPTATPAPTDPEPAKGPEPDPVVPPSVDLDPIFRPIEGVLALGKGAADSDALGKALLDPERDIRLAAVIALDRATGDATPRLLAALHDPNPRVVRLAIRALGRRRAGATEIAPFLSDSALATSEEAREALERIGADAAMPTVAQMETGHYGAIHHGRLVFETLGPAGAPLTARLAALLGHADVNVRETAARCLLSIGPGARGAAPALVRALHDARLCVVANAAIALGRVGLTDEAVAATEDPSARVRAYATFAIGWSSGELNGVDQVAFERRLPVLDVGTTGPFPTATDVEAIAPLDEDKPHPGAPGVEILRRAIQSKDPHVAVPAAARLDYNSVDATEVERVMELLLPEGLREGSVVDFDRMRSNLGSSELVASLEYTALAGRTSPRRKAIYDFYHKVSRADSLPGLRWFERNEEPAIIRDDELLWMPRERTKRYGADVHPGQAAASIEVTARRGLEEFRKEPAKGAPPQTLWALRDFVPSAEDAGLVLECAHLAEDEIPSGTWSKDSTAWVMFRLLGYLSDDASLAYLKSFADETSDWGTIASASLARRGDARALQSLIKESREDDEAFAYLMDVAPLAASRELVVRLLDPLKADAACHLGADLVKTSLYIGARIPPEAFLGVEAVVAAHVTDFRRLDRIARSVPGCATRRIGRLLIERLGAFAATASVPSDDSEDGGFTPETFRACLGYLLASDPNAARDEIRALAASPDGNLRHAAADVLFHLDDEKGLPLVVASLRARGPDEADLAVLAVSRRPEIASVFLDWSKSSKLTDRHEDMIIDTLAALDGWREMTFNGSLGEAFDVSAHALLRRGDLAALRALSASVDASEWTPIWTRLGRKAMAGDRVARAEFWSACRAGRFRWIHHIFYKDVHTLGRDPAVLPHWTSDFDSNCCRISDGLDRAFEEPFGFDGIYDAWHQGVGRPASEYVREWMGARAARFVWSPLADHFIPEPE